MISQVVGSTPDAQFLETASGKSGNVQGRRRHRQLVGEVQQHVVCAVSVRTGWSDGTCGWSVLFGSRWRSKMAASSTCLAIRSSNETVTPSNVSPAFESNAKDRDPETGKVALLCSFVRGGRSAYLRCRQDPPEGSHVLRRTRRLLRFCGGERTCEGNDPGRNGRSHGVGPDKVATMVR